MAVQKELRDLITMTKTHYVRQVIEGKAMLDMCNATIAVSKMENLNFRQLKMRWKRPFSPKEEWVLKEELGPVIGGIERSAENEWRTSDGLTAKSAKEAKQLKMSSFKEHLKKRLSEFDRQSKLFCTPACPVKPKRRMAFSYTELTIFAKTLSAAMKEVIESTPLKEGAFTNTDHGIGILKAGSTAVILNKVRIDYRYRANQCEVDLGGIYLPFKVWHRGEFLHRDTEQRIRLLGFDDRQLGCIVQDLIEILA